MVSNTCLVNPVDLHIVQQMTRALSENLRQSSCNPNPKINDGSPPKFNQFLLVTHRSLPKKSPKFINNFPNYPANRQTNTQTPDKAYPDPVWRRQGRIKALWDPRQALNISCYVTLRRI